MRRNAKKRSNTECQSSDSVPIDTFHGTRSNVLSISSALNLIYTDISRTETTLVPPPSDASIKTAGDMPVPHALTISKPDKSHLSPTYGSEKPGEGTEAKIAVVVLVCRIECRAVEQRVQVDITIWHN